MDGSRIELMQRALNGVREPGLLEYLRRVVSQCDSNLIEVEDSEKEKTLCTLPPKLGQSACIKIGNFIIVEEGARDRSAEAGRKFIGTIARLLTDEHVLILRESSFWPSYFQDSSHKPRGVTEAPADVEAPRARSERNHEKSQDATEPPASVEVLIGLAGQNGKRARGSTEHLALLEAPKAPVKGNDEEAQGTAEAPVTPEAPRVLAEQNGGKVPGAAEFPAPVEIPRAGVERNGEKVHGVPEPPAPVESAKAPIEQNGVEAQGVELPAIIVEGPKARVGQYGENYQSAIEPPAPVEAPHIPVEQNGEKSRGATEFPATLQAPSATSEQNNEKMPGASELTAPVETSKALGKHNGQKAGGSADPLAIVEAPTAPFDNNVGKLGGAFETPASMGAPETSIEQSSGDEEFDNAEQTNKDQNSSFRWIIGGTNVTWDIAKSQSVLGPGPTEVEKSVQYKPTPGKELHTYFMIRIPKLSDNRGKTEIRMAELRFKEVAKKRDFINAALQMKRASRMEALHKLRTARENVRACADALRQKREEISPLQGALRKLRKAGRQARDKSRDLPASERELDEKIAYCEYRIQHESIPLKEEKQLLREMKGLRASREVVCANEALHAEFSESLCEQDDIQERLKPLMCELESLKSEWTIATKTSKAAEAEFEEKDTALNQVLDQWTSANQARQAAFHERTSLIRQGNAQNNEFYQNRREIQHVRHLAFKKEKKAVEEFCNAQVERVMTLWNGNAEFRAAYVKSNEKSTLKRLQTFDGRALGTDEEPPLISGDSDDSLSETQTDIGSSVSPAKSQREGPAASHNFVFQTTDSERKGKHLKSPISLEPNEHRSSSKHAAGMEAVLDGQDEKGEEALAAAAKLKQKRREQEMAKARDADERKRKSVQRLQFKALAKAQKETDRQDKDKEKRSQKKAARLSNSSERTTPATEVGRGAMHKVEEGLDLLHELSPKSGPICRYQKRPPSQILKTVKTPLDSSFTKKDYMYPPSWFWRVGLVGFLVILAFLAIFLL